MNDQEKVLCPNCGGRSELNSSYCIFCGKEIKKKRKNYPKKLKTETKTIEEIEFLDVCEELEKKEIQDKTIWKLALTGIIGVIVLSYCLFMIIISPNNDGSYLMLISIISFMFVFGIMIISTIYLKFPKIRKKISNTLIFLKYLIFILILVGLFFAGPCIFILPFVGIIN